MNNRSPYAPSSLSASLVFALALITSACGSDADDNPAATITSPTSTEIEAPFDLISSRVRSPSDQFLFSSEVAGNAGESIPVAVGSLDGAPVLSYVWPTTLDSSAVGFELEQGILALAATVHPDFDDTPLYDEDGDGDVANDGARWHSHWVVLVETPECGGGLSVRDIPDGEEPATPSTWPGLPILIDSPNFPVEFDGDSVEIGVETGALGNPAGFSFDGVTSLLRVSADGGPLLCVEEVFDVASGDLSLPGTVTR